MHPKRHRILVAVLFFFAAAARADDGRDGERPNWFSAWSISIGHRMLTTLPAGNANFAENTAGKTVRMIVRPSISGDAVRVKIENTMATTPVVFSSAFIGVVDTGAALVSGSNRRLTFQGKSALTLAAGQGATSDPVPFRVEAFRRLAVSLDVASATEVSGHQLGLTTNYIAPGAVGSNASGKGFAPIAQNNGNHPFYWVAAVDVRSGHASGTIVTLGDSITDGRCSTRLPDGIFGAETRSVVTEFQRANGLKGGELTLDAKIANLNEPQTINAPANPARCPSTRRPQKYVTSTVKNAAAHGTRRAAQSCTPKSR